MEDCNLGRIFSLHRKRKKVTLDKVAEYTGIIKSSISEFENGKKALSITKITKLYEAINISYQFNTATIQIAEQSVLSLYDDISFGKSFEEKYRSHQKIKNNCMFDSSYITWLLGNYIYHLYSSKHLYAFEKNTDLLLEHRMCLSEKMEQLLYDSIGYYYFITNQHEKSLDMFNEGKDKPILESVTAMLLYHSTMLCVDEGNIYEALESIKKAKRMFDKNLNFYRSILCSIELGMIFTRIRNYNKAEKILIQCIKAGEELSCAEQTQATSYNNLFWVYILSKQYEKIISYENDIKELKFNDASIDSHIAYAYWRKGNIEKAKEYLKSSKARFEQYDERWKYFIDAFTSMMLNKPYLIIERKLDALYSSTLKYYSYDMQIFALKLLIEYNDKERNFEKSNQLREKVIEIYEKDFISYE